MKSNRAFVRTQGILVAVKSECSVKRVSCKAWTGTSSDHADPDQTLQNAASDQDLYCLRKVQEVKNK